MSAARSAAALTMLSLTFGLSCNVQSARKKRTPLKMRGSGGKDIAPERRKVAFGNQNADSLQGVTHPKCPAELLRGGTELNCYSPGLLLVLVISVANGNRHQGRGLSGEGGDRRPALWTSDTSRRGAAARALCLIGHSFERGADREQRVKALLQAARATPMLLTGQRRAQTARCIPPSLLSSVERSKTTRKLAAGALGVNVVQASPRALLVYRPSSSLRLRHFATCRLPVGWRVKS